MTPGHSLVVRTAGSAVLALLLQLATSGLATADDSASMTAASRSAATEDAAAQERFRSLDEEVQDLKDEVLDLNRDLFLLEEELLFPANSQVAFFLSMDVGEYFALDSVSLQIDGKEVANYLYTDREVDALMRGGVHRVHMENLKVGDHELIAIFTGKGPHWRDYRRGATVSLEKGIGAKYVELQISDRIQKQQPEFQIREWE
ncbi:MAG: AraC family transcriptional regulator [Woeseiaceae bacterium]|nr:AraC family transcriptional regulator [Woeseiaceae bacterium]